MKLSLDIPIPHGQLILFFMEIIFYVMRYLNECEFNIFGDLNNEQNESENVIVKWNFNFYDYDLCDRPHCATPHSPRSQIILSIVTTIFGISLQGVLASEKNENVNIYCNGYERLGFLACEGIDDPPPYPTCSSSSKII